MAYILYEGPSVLDGKPIVVIMTKGPCSRNEKTGVMAQTYILRSDIPPIEAIKTGADESICGNCPHRFSTGGSCYVNVGQGPRTIYLAYKRGNYKYRDFSEETKEAGKNQNIRIGTYGDPSAVPIKIWKLLTSMANSWTGYTHQALNNPELKGLLQASADSRQEAGQLQALGWKTFRVKLPDDPLMPNEVYCPNESHGVQCINCRLCNGEKINVAINIHGLNHKITKFKHWSLNNA